MIDLLAKPRSRERAERRFFDLVRNGRPKAGAERSSEEFLAAVVAHNAWLPFEDFERELLDPRNAIGRKARERQGDGYLRGVWDAAEQVVAKRPSILDHEGGRRAVAWRREAWAREPFRQRAGATDRAVFNAILDVAERLGTLFVDLSVRTVKDEASVSRGTAHAALTRLEARGCIRRVDRGTRRLAARYEIRLPARTNLDTYIPPKGGGGCTSGVSELARKLQRHDAFRAQALGKRAAEVCAILCEEGPLSCRDVADRCDVGVRQVQAIVRKLASHRLAKPEANGVWRSRPPSDAALDSIAEQFGTLGAGLGGRARTAAERETYSEARRQYAMAEHHAAEMAAWRQKPAEISPVLDATRSDQMPNVAVAAHVPTGIRGRPGLGLAAALVAMP